ncbi:type VI secretion system lipoprotein TssJ, partial [Pseudomonas viridiflava]|uniref:type VI secretion system lipoprotein TssJ n=1 Tax=Pseudomonas viridiflava TaxID=33069 RepID=UPI001F07FC2C
MKTLRLDFTGRASLNTDSAEMNALSVATLVRIYQLRASRAFEQASYDRLVTAAASALSADLVDEQAVVIKPGGGAQLSVPLHSEARYVAVVALYRQPDLEQNSWRLLVPRDELHP